MDGLRDHISTVKYVAFIAGASAGLLLARGFIAGVNKLFPPDPFNH
jgi:hypothetical protein